MNKRKVFWILYAVLVFILIGIAVCMLVIKNHEDNRNAAEDLEQLKDQLKVFLPVETETESETEPEGIQETEDVSETEESEIPESAVMETIPETEEMIVIPAETEPDLPEETEQETEELPKEISVPAIREMTIDFSPLWKVNPDVHGWIEIEGTKVDYPVLQSPDNDSKYLNTALDGSYYIGGSLFTQAGYNSKDFNDPVTVIYGHTMRSGTLFGQLQEIYTSKSTFEKYSEIKLYLPDEARRYTVFAAVPYSSAHIPATYDFSKKYWFNNFFDGVFEIRKLGAQFNRDIAPEYGDRVIILSTCLNEDSTKRFLVMAICQDDIE